MSFLCIFGPVFILHADSGVRGLPAFGNEVKMKSQEPKLIPMSKRRRHLMLRVADDQASVPPILHLLYHMPRCDEMLEWLVRNHFTGAVFMNWIKNSHGNSPISMMTFILSRLPGEGKVRPLIVGEDYIVR